MSQSVGQCAYDLLQKPPEAINVMDMQREMQKHVLKNLEEIIESHGDYASKYYIVYIIQRERTMSTVIKQKFVSRQSRPLPDYDTSLFSYDNNKGELLFHWTIPDEETCEYFLHNKSSLREEEKPLLGFIEKFADNTLV